MELQMVGPRELDWDVADEMSALTRLSADQAGLPLNLMSGPALMLYLQHGWDGTPSSPIHLARQGGELVGFAYGDLPVRDNTELLVARGCVAPDARQRGIGRTLLGSLFEVVPAGERPHVFASGFIGTGAPEALAALGFAEQGRNVIRRIDLQRNPPSRWRALERSSSAHSSEYELLRLEGEATDDLLSSMVSLHAAINDAPKTDPDVDDDIWDEDRVRSFDRCSTLRRNSIHRVVARHRGTGEWAGMSMVLVDEFGPSIANQEDTSVVRAHRGHRLGLRMKAEMLDWLTTTRHEITAIDTWNASTNHHMIAVNEILGAEPIATSVGFSLDR
jgi:GNAT superfamily N-acetyltransferase